MMQGKTTYRLLTRGSSSNPPLLLLHGFLGSAEEWLPVASALEEHYHCIMADLPGHGETPASFDTFENQIDRLAGTIANLHLPPVALAGYSMGGRIALYLTLRHPHLFRQTVVISGSPGLEGAEERQLRRESDERIAASIERDFHAFLKSWYAMPLFAELNRHPSFSATLEARKKNRSNRLATALRTLGTGNQPSLWQELKECTVPIRFFAGKNDLKYVGIGQQIADLCPCCSLDIFPGCGHALHLENGELFVDRLLISLTTRE